MVKVVLDNDILIKGASYELLRELIQVLQVFEAEVGCLGAARFLVPTKLKKSKLKKNNKIAISHFNEFLSRANFIEPTEEESRLAGKLEFIAQQKTLLLDSGESQLLAILIMRTLSNLATGDKRAISSMEIVLEEIIEIDSIRGKVICIEQLFLRLVNLLGQTVCQKVCDEPQVDTALSICFNCHRSDSTSDQWIDGLNSYIEDIRKQAPVLLNQ